MAQNLVFSSLNHRGAALTPKYKSPRRTCEDLMVQAATLDFMQMEAREWLVKNLVFLKAARAACFVLLQHEHCELTLRRNARMKSEWFFKADFELEAALVEEARLSASILRKDPNEPQAVFRLLAGLNMGAPNEILSLPFYYNERVLGFLMLLGSSRGAFTAKDVTFGNRLSTLISRSLYNSRLVQELNVANAELEVNRWQLINSRNTLRALFDSVPISIYIIDRDYKLVAVNMQKAKTTTYHPKRLVGEKCYQAI